MHVVLVAAGDEENGEQAGDIIVTGECVTGIKAETLLSTLHAGGGLDADSVRLVAQANLTIGKGALAADGVSAEAAALTMSSASKALGPRSVARCNAAALGTAGNKVLNINLSSFSVSHLLKSYLSR